jgi:acetoin utilization protein AcuC
LLESCATVNVLVHHPALDAEGYPSSIPFNTGRAGAALGAIRSMSLVDGADRREFTAQPLVRGEMERFHTPDYLDALEAAGRCAISPDEALQYGLGSADCPIFVGMYEYTRLAAGASLTAARLILDGTAQVAFNLSGGYHHAMPSRAAGFCYVNDVVLAAMELAQAGKRVCFLDLDVHHCDGVQHAFYGRKDVLTVSLHESGRTLFPGTGFSEELGSGEGEGFNVNVPLPVGTHDDAYLFAFQQAAWPIIRAYNPDVVIVEIGMDALADDPLAHLSLTNNAHADVLIQLRGLGRPILATGGGGYNFSHTIRSWALAWDVLTGEDQSQAFMLCLGGDMLENTAWVGGLRDRIMVPDPDRRAAVEDEIRQTVDTVRRLVFPFHRLA